MNWSDAARATIRQVHATLPESATLKERMTAIDAAYPFGTRAYWPYKAWCKARRAYLLPFGYRPRGYTPPPGLFDGWARDPVTGRPVIP